MSLPKGVSGNPAGQSKQQAQLRLLAARRAAEYMEEAIEVHVRVMRDLGAPHAAQVSAANSIIERAVGKAVAPHELSGELIHNFPVDRPPVETREAWIGRRSRELGIASNVLLGGTAGTAD